MPPWDHCSAAISALLTAPGKTPGRQGIFPWNVKSTVLTSGCNSTSPAFGAYQGDFGFQTGQTAPVLCCFGANNPSRAEINPSRLKACSARFPLGMAAPEHLPDRPAGLERLGDVQWDVMGGSCPPQPPGEVHVRIHWSGNCSC